MKPVKKPAVTYEDFYKLDLRVARITWASRVDGADRLLKLSLDVGSMGPRTVVAPIAMWYKPNELIGRRVVYLANLKFKRSRGIISQGMILTTATYNSKTQEDEPGLVVPDGKITLGSPVR